METSLRLNIGLGKNKVSKLKKDLYGPSTV